MVFWIATSTDEWYNCLDTNDVEPAAKGGLFNCGETGIYLQIDCFICPKFSILELAIWEEKAILGAVPYYWSNYKNFLIL